MRSFTALFLFLIILVVSSCAGNHKKIDRHALVTRHNVKINTPHPLNSLSVGNGSFAFTADFTGMQTFPEYYEHGVSLGNQSEWGWHSFPNPDSFTIDDVQKYFTSGTREVPYSYQFVNDTDERKDAASQWLRENPHRLHLGIIGLYILKNDSTPALFSDIKPDGQILNLWTGIMESNFELDGVKVKVQTACHQELDMVSFRISSALFANGNIGVWIRFPYASDEKFSPGYDFNKPDNHNTTIAEQSAHEVLFVRQLDDTRYYAKAEWDRNGSISSVKPHEYVIQPVRGDNTLEISICFDKEKISGKLPLYAATSRNSKSGLKQFWESGGAIDFSACTDPRAKRARKAGCSFSVSHQNSVCRFLPSPGNRIDL